jgi:hypothetical protein
MNNALKPWLLKLHDKFRFSFSVVERYRGNSAEN